MPNQSVRGGRAFRQGILPWRKGMGILAHSPCGALSSTPHRRRQGFSRADWLVPLRGTSPWGHIAALVALKPQCVWTVASTRPSAQSSPRRGEAAEGGFASYLAAPERRTTATLLRCAASALSPLRDGALRSALRYPLCSGGGCQATTYLNRSGLSQRNATSLRFKPSWHRRVAKRTEVPAVWRRRLPSNTPPQPLGLIPAECCQLSRPFSLGYFSFGPAKEK